MSVIACPGCGRETNTVFIDSEEKVCYLTISDDRLYWRRGCVPKDASKQNPYFVYSAKQMLDTPIKYMEEKNK